MSFKISKKLAIALSVAAACASIATVAKAEYLCNAPPTQWDKNACELAKHDSPRELVQYVRRMKAIFNMDANDYAKADDVVRWEIARANADKPASVDTASGENALIAKK